MKDMPGMSEGIKVPEDLSSLLKEENKEAQEEFKAGARTILQK
jgi:hypothetical protein